MKTPDKHFDILSLGECMVEFSPVKNHQWQIGFAGDAYNTLVYASRLGMRCGFITCIGKDTFHKSLLNAIEEEKIYPVCTRTLADRQNGIYFIQTGINGERQFQYYRAQSAATQIFKEIPVDEIIREALRSRIFYFTAVSVAIAEEREKLGDILKKIKGKTVVAFDANYRASLWSSERVYRRVIGAILPFVDIILPSEADERILHPECNAQQLFPIYEKSGTLCCMKSGGIGASLIVAGVLQNIPAVKRKAIDTTAAGDAFNAGFLTGVVKKYSAMQSAKLGNAAAGIVIRHRGAIVDREAWTRERSNLPLF